jgi:hypothetical protein
MVQDALASSVREVTEQVSVVYNTELAVQSSIADLAGKAEAEDTASVEAAASVAAVNAEVASLEAEAARLTSEVDTPIFLTGCEEELAKLLAERVDSTHLNYTSENAQSGYYQKQWEEFKRKQAELSPGRGAGWQGYRVSRSPDGSGGC